MQITFRPSRDGWLATAAVAGALALFAAVFLLMQSAMGAVARNANALDDRRAEEAMQAALNLSVRHLINVTEINSVWDDAVTEGYRRRVDPAWLHASYGALAQADGDYDAVYLLDDRGNILWGEDRGTVVSKGDVGGLGQGAGRIFASYAWQPRPGDPAGGITRLTSGPAFVGLGLIRPSSDAVEAPDGRRYLLMVRRLDAAIFSGYAGAYSLRRVGFSSAATSDNRPGTLLRDAAGNILGRLSWDTRAPGMQAARAAWPNLEISLALTAALLAIFAGAMIAGLRRLRRSERRAITAAMTDPLTGLPNRMAFLSRLKALGRDHNLAVVCIDLDRFKEINDIYGSGAADGVLTDLARRLEAAAPEESFVARIGGDLFGVVLWGLVAEIRVHGMIEDLRQVMSEPVTVGGGQVTLVTSTGLAYTRRGFCDENEVFRRALAALDYAKSENRGNLVRYDDDIDAAAQRELSVARDIRLGLSRQEFDVVYQPIVNAVSGRINEVEALVRWPRRPDGPLYPDDFITVAEKHGLIHDLGMFVLRQACTDMACCPGIRLGVNVSPAQFRDPRFGGDVGLILDTTGFPPSLLELEVTESYLIDLPDQALAVIETLRARGIAVALDDFGTGYSSIGYLRRYHFDKLKIDKSLAGDVAANDNGALVIATVALARALGIAVTAEGVETAEQAALLRMAGCENLQGYYFGRPQAVASIAEQLHAPCATAV